MFWFQKPDFWAFYSPELLLDAKGAILSELRQSQLNHSGFGGIEIQSEHGKQSKFLGVSCCKSVACERNLS
jgi:hypothetical protein